MRSKKYTAEVLAPIVTASSSLAEVIRKLGLRPTGGNHRFIGGRIRQAGLDMSHVHQGKLARRLREEPRELLEELVRTSSSVAQVLAALGLPQEGRPHHELTRYLARNDLDTSYFRGAGWSRGETAKSHPSIEKVRQRRMRTNEEVFVENSPVLGQGPALIRRLVALGWQYQCALCGICKWRDMPLVLHLDRINGINNDNRFINIRLLCRTATRRPTRTAIAPEASRLAPPSGVVRAIRSHLASVLEWQTMRL